MMQLATRRPADLPAGRVTFLFTDVVGSTRLWERDPDAMHRALARHNLILSDAITEQGGTVFKMTGDGICAAFPAAPAAVQAAVAVQGALRAEPWERTPLAVRMALHTGTITPEQGDYLGPVVNRVARLLGAGHGGQILLSGTTQEQVATQLAPGTTLRDLGERRLRDFVRPEHVYQLVAPGLPAEFPPLRAPEAFAHNLPAPATSFVGRTREKAEVTRQVGQTRLLTLIGPGGTGKTRLSLEVAAGLAERFADGVWLVELAPIADPDLVPQALAAVFGVRDEPGRPLLAGVTTYLEAKQILLVLDNCEHLISAAAELAKALLRACPQIQILASSREALGVPGETIWRVPSLAVPDPRTLPAGTALRDFEAVRLFADRAAAVRPDFVLDDHNAPVVAHICHRLDGIPLAIELAAARVRNLPIEQIAARLDDRFRLLTGGSRTALPRQQTLRALIDWSHDLLSDEERIILRRLSVFAGGWTLDAAEAILDFGYGSATPELDVLEGLSGLVNKSLVSEPGADGRYTCLETIRQYGREKLVEAGGAAAVRARHRDYYVRLAEEADPRLRGPEQRAWLDRLVAEQDNLRTAYDWCRAEAEAGDSGGVQAALRLAGALGFWFTGTNLSEGRAWVEEMLARPASAPPTAARAQALLALGVLAYQQQDSPAACAALAESVALWRALDRPRQLALALGFLSIASHYGKDPDTARAACAESLALAEQLGDTWTRALAYCHLAFLAPGNDNRQDSLDHFTASLVLARQVGDVRLVARVLNGLGEVHRVQGNMERAAACYAESLALYETLGRKLETAMLTVNVGAIAYARGDYDEAAACFAEALVRHHEVGSKRFVATCLAALGQIAAVRHTPERAARLFAAGDALLHTLNAQYDVADQITITAAQALAQSQIDPAAWDAAWREGESWPLDQATAYALEDEGP